MKIIEFHTQSFINAIFAGIILTLIWKFLSFEIMVYLALVAIWADVAVWRGK